MRTTGPKNPPTLAVPRDWTTNNATRIPIEIGITKGWRCASTTVSPSTADSTEIAGVIIASP